MTADEANNPRNSPSDTVLPTAANVIAFTGDTVGSACADCATTLCGHDAVLSLVLGYRSGPRCHACLAAAVQEDPHRLVTRVCRYLNGRDCYRAGWSWANRDEGFDDAPPSGPPPCMPDTEVATEAQPPPPSPPPSAPPPDSSPADALRIVAAFDAGDMACGDLVLELRLKMRDLQPGDVLHVTALDPGAPTDIPAWCGLTRHTLRAQAHPDYWIQRRP